MDDVKFEEWLQATLQKYKKLPVDQRNKTLNALISHSSGWQLYYLSKTLLKIVYRDFFVQLPLEITYRILEYLDTESIIACCKVTCEWNEVVSSCQAVWKEACVEVGLKLPADNDIGKEVGLKLPADNDIGKEVGLKLPADNDVDKEVGLKLPADSNVDKEVGLKLPADSNVDKEVGLKLPADSDVDKEVGLKLPADSNVDKDVGVKLPADNDVDDDDTDFEDSASTMSQDFQNSSCRKEISYKQLYETQVERLEKLSNGYSFEMRFLDGHTGAVTALYYRDNKVATGSDDHTVRIWDVKSRLCILEVSTDHTVSAVKFNDSIMLIASFFGTVVQWNLETREFICDYTGHVNAVPSLDFNQLLDLLVTASYDTSIKLWSLSKGTLIRSITQEIAPFPIFRPLVRLIPNPGPYGGDCIYTILACYSGRGGMNSSVDLRCSVYRLTCDHCLLEDTDHGDADVGMPRYDLPYMVDVLRFNLFHGGIKKLDDALPTVQKLQTMPLFPHEIEVLETTASYGSCFGFVLHTAKGQIVIYDRRSLKIVSQITLPNCSVRGHGLAILCQREWLNGMNDSNCSGLLFVIARNHQVLLLKWKAPINYAGKS